MSRNLNICSSKASFTFPITLMAQTQTWNLRKTLQFHFLQSRNWLPRPHKLFIYWYTDQLTSLQLISLLQPPAPLTPTGWHKQTGQLSSGMKRQISDKETPGIWSSMILFSLSPQNWAGRSTSGTQVQGRWAGLLYIKYSMTKLCKIHIEVVSFGFSMFCLYMHVLELPCGYLGA